MRNSKCISWRNTAMSLEDDEVDSDEDFEEDFDSDYDDDDEE